MLGASRPDRRIYVWVGVLQATPNLLSLTLSIKDGFDISAIEALAILPIADRCALAALETDPIQARHIDAHRRADELGVVRGGARRCVRSVNLMVGRHQVLHLRTRYPHAAVGVCIPVDMRVPAGVHVAVFVLVDGVPIHSVWELTA